MSLSTSHQKVAIKKEPQLLWAYCEIIDHDEDYETPAECDSIRNKT